jgi:hypothetical protein
MIITDFNDNYLMYEKMAIWEVSSLENFFKSHEMLGEIFEKEYGFSYAERNEPGKQLNDTEVTIISKLLDYFGDKYFFIFSYNDKHHNGLKELQDKKIINFGIDVHVINPNRTYVLEMDKTKDLKMYDTV